MSHKDEFFRPETGYFPACLSTGNGTEFSIKILGFYIKNIDLLVKKYYYIFV